MKTIGVLTSGGDSQGMNAAVRAVVKAAFAKNMKVYGIHYGYRGLLERNIQEFTQENFPDIIAEGGTFLKTARCKKFKEPQYVQEAVDICKEYGIEGLVVIGGDGSFKGARDLCHAGIKCVAIPATIDNDIVCTDYAIGFDTAINRCVDYIDGVKATAAAHDRCIVYEVMGKYDGWLALEVAKATDAIALVVPEIKFDFQKDVIDRIVYGLEHNKQTFTVVVAEGLFMDDNKKNVNHDYLKTENIDTAAKFAKRIMADTKGKVKYMPEDDEENFVDTRANTPGHLQRGGYATAKDRNTATDMGLYAVGLLEKDSYNRVVVMKNAQITDVDITEGLAMKRPFSVEEYENVLALNK